MARTEITATTATLDGVVQAQTTGVADGHMFDNSGTGKKIVRVENTHATLARDITFQTDYDVIGLPLNDKTVSIPALSVRYFGPFPTAYFNRKADPDKDFVYIDYDTGNESDLEVEVYDVP